MARARFRYAKDPWLVPLIAEIAALHPDIVEIGCGQATDGLTFCRVLPPAGSYLGLDCSEESLHRARDGAEELAGALQVRPRFLHADAEALPFADASVACVYSMGVLHHSPDTVRTVAEIRRVLRPGGSAYVMLYRTWSPKVALAHVCRGFQRGLDGVLGRDRAIYAWLKDRPMPAALGTALLEGFGVPVLRSYTAGGMRALFDGFRIRRLMACGNNSPPSGEAEAASEVAANLLGVFYLIEVEKP